LKPLNEESDKKKIIIQKYNSTSSFYDDRYRKIQNEKYAIQLKNTDFKHKTLLDAGCGTGLLFEYLSCLKNYDLHKDMRYIGLDISWKMLKNFSSKINTTNYLGRISLILGDIENLPFRERAFNLIFSITSLQNLQTLKKGLNELIRVGKRNTVLKLSILKKQLKLKQVIMFLDSCLINLKTDILEELEDVIIEGILNKD
jgi:demethylmenaquinone methyltransferase/2-methoxy-6-polyprenyl-1,4-benzoquinol methylase